MENKSGIIRRKSKGFAQVSNFVLRDTRLSLKAKGLYSLIESYLTIDDWNLYKTYLISQCKEKETSFNSAWNELKKNGYLIQIKSKDKDTGKWVYEYELLDEPQKQNPGVENPGVENPHVENMGYINNTDINNTDINNTNSKEQYSDNKYNDKLNSILSYSDLSEEEKIEDNKEKEIIKPLVPEEYKEEFDRSSIKRFEKDRSFYGINFDNGQFYNIFADAVSKTQLQDNVEVITRDQYAYFASTLRKMLEVVRV